MNSAGKVLYTETGCPIGYESGKSRFFKRQTTRMTAANDSVTPAATGQTAVVALLKSDKLTAPQRKPAKISLDSTLVLLETITKNGRDCEWALRVEEGSPVSCTDFMAKIAADGSWFQARARVKLAKMSVRRGGQKHEQLEQAEKFNRAIMAYRQFARSRLAGR